MDDFRSLDDLIEESIALYGVEYTIQTLEDMRDTELEDAPFFASSQDQADLYQYYIDKLLQGNLQDLDEKEAS